MCRETAQLVRQAVGAGRRAYVLVNNRAEGNAPLTVQSLTELLATLGDVHDRSEKPMARVLRLWESLPRPADPFKFRMEEGSWCVRDDHCRDNGESFSDLSRIHDQDRGDHFALDT